MSKMKRLYKANMQANEAIKAIFVRYFVSFGLSSGSNYAFESAEFIADFKIKFGNNEYRRVAWLAVCDEVKALVPLEVYTTLDAHFANGTAARFLIGFDYKTLLRHKSCIR